MTSGKREYEVFVLARNSKVFPFSFVKNVEGWRVEVEKKKNTLSFFRLPPLELPTMSDAAAAPAPAPAPAAPSGTGSKTPADFLKSIKGRPVIVKLNSGSDYRGT